MSILLTGGLGYIGSHTAVELLERDKDIIIVDDLSNSKIEVKDKIKEITGKDFKFIEGDLKDYAVTEDIFKNNNIEAIVHSRISDFAPDIYEVFKAYPLVTLTRMAEMAASYIN